MTSLPQHLPRFIRPYIKAKALFASAHDTAQLRRTRSGLMVAHRNSADSKPFLAIEPRKGEMPDPTPRPGGRAYQCPAPTPPSRRRASAQLGTAASHGWARARRGKKRASCTLAQLKGGFVGKVRLRFVLRRLAVAIRIRDAFHGGRCHGNACSRCALGRSAMARCSRNAFLSVRQWRDVRGLRPPTSGGGRISPWCVPGRPSVAIFSRDAFSGG